MAKQTVSYERLFEEFNNALQQRPGYVAGMTIVPSPKGAQDHAIGGYDFEGGHALDTDVFVQAIRIVNEHYQIDVDARAQAGGPKWP